MQLFQGQYFGAALHAFVKGLSQSEALTEQILRAHGLERIDPELWYDLNPAYQMNVRGPEIGSISGEFEGDNTALVTFATPFPCALTRGILQGCARKFAADALVEHGPDGCVDRGDESCHFHVAW